ncbi:MAG TPA: holo-ACP synthase [Myxococcaceae bacterium]|nr:holo-ACP synthase [Myxococcaceae bacterium]
MAIVGLGLDVCAVDRIQRILQSPRGGRFLERVYTPAERDVCGKRADAASAYAARFAAKEALVKALGAPPGLRWQEMEIVRESGAPRFRLSGAAAEEVRQRAVRIHLSMTHDGGVAAATVVLEGAAAEREHP